MVMNACRIDLSQLKESSARDIPQSRFHSSTQLQEAIVFYEIRIERKVS